jgi:hypothetical protein
MRTLTLLFRWRLIHEFGKLLFTVGDGFEDGRLTPSERSRMMKQFWTVVRTYRGVSRTATSQQLPDSYRRASKPERSWTR